MLLAGLTRLLYVIYKVSGKIKIEAIGLGATFFVVTNGKYF
jgi:hypothetical protein